jgi:hypothetical protein
MATGSIRSHLVLGLLGLALASASCGDGEGAGEPTSSDTPSPSGASSTATITTSPSPEPSPSASPPAAVELGRGTATLALSGSVDLDAAPTLASRSSYAPPPGELRLTWRGGKILFGLGGTSFMGTRPTSGDLVLQIIVLVGGGDVVFTSDAGECRIAVSRADADRVEGSFSCDRLIDESGDKAVRATGTFEASR